MAHLARLEISDFRAFRHATLEFKCDGLTLVTGPNNVGKSALLSALDIVAGVNAETGIGLADLLHVDGDEVAIRATFLLNADEREQLLGSTSETARLMRRGAAQWVEWEFTWQNDALYANAVRVAWPDTGPKLIAATRREQNGSWTYLDTGKHIAVHDGELSNSQRGSFLPSALENAFNMPYLKPAADYLAAWRTGFFHFKPLRQASGRRNTMHSSSTLAPDGANLDQVLLHLRNNKPAVWDSLNTIIKEIVPGSGRLVLPSEGTQFEIAFSDQRERSRPRNLKDLGTGVEQLLMARCRYDLDSDYHGS